MFTCVVILQDGHSPTLLAVEVDIDTQLLKPWTACKPIQASRGYPVSRLETIILRDVHATEGLWNPLATFRTACLADAWRERCKCKAAFRNIREHTSTDSPSAGFKCAKSAGVAAAVCFEGWAMVMQPTRKAHARQLKAARVLPLASITHIISLRQVPSSSALDGRTRRPSSHSPAHRAGAR